jgi:hypothetical protein
MSRAIHLRLKRLEAQRKGKTSQILVWCDEEADVEGTIRQMIAEGRISEADRPRCVYWQNVTDCEPGTHERRLAQLDD